MKYTVIIEETLSRSVVVEAEDEIDALSKANDMYFDEEIVLDADDFKEVEFKAIKGEGDGEAD